MPGSNDITKLQIMQVKFDVDFVDKNTNECYVNVFGDDGEKVTDLVSKIETFLSNGVKTEHIDLHNYNSDQSIPIKNCFFSSRIYEQLCESKEKVGLTNMIIRS